MAAVSWIGKNAAKLAVGAGAVYVTINQGVWGSTSNEGAKALRNVTSSVMPSVNEYVKKIPTITEVDNSIKETWNSGVKKTFSTIEQLPDSTKEYSKKALKSSMDLIKK